MAPSKITTRLPGGLEVGGAALVHGQRAVRQHGRGSLMGVHGRGHDPYSLRPVVGFSLLARRAVARRKWSPSPGKKPGLDGERPGAPCGGVPPAPSVSGAVDGGGGADADEHR